MSRKTYRYSELNLNQYSVVILIHYICLPVYAAAGRVWKAAGRFWLCGKVAHS